MFKILAEQFQLDGIDGPSQGAPDLLILQVACFTPMAIPDPRNPMGAPPVGQVPIPTCLIQVPMNAAERAKLRQLLDAFDQQNAQAEPAGEAQPEGVEARRCGRLQQHPAHTYPYTDDPSDPVRTVWCDGGSALTDAGGVGEATDELPDATDDVPRRPQITNPGVW